MNLAKLKDVRFLTGDLPARHLKKYPVLRFMNWVRFKIELWVIRKVAETYGIKFKHQFGEALEALHKREQEDILIKKLNVSLYGRSKHLGSGEKYKESRSKAAINISPEGRVKHANDRIFRIYSHKRRRKYGSVLYSVAEDFEEMTDANEEKVEEKSGGGVEKDPRGTTSGTSGGSGGPFRGGAAGDRGDSGEGLGWKPESARQVSPHDPEG